MKREFDEIAKQLLPVIEPVLREQRITETEPGSVAREFETFIGFIASRNVFASGKNDLLPMSALAELNARMTRPIEIRLKRPMQKSYPNLHGLYLMARASGIMRVARVKTGALLILDSQAMASWTSLNPTEKYFALLEAWWLRATMEMVGERGGRGAGFQTDVLMRIHNTPPEGLKVDKKQAEWLPYWGLHNIALMGMFGLARIEHGPAQEGKGWIISEIKRSEFGDALAHLIWSGFPFGRVFDIAFGGDDEGRKNSGGQIIFDSYRELLAPYFPEWQNSLTLSPGADYRDGVFTFKVSLGKVWRRIVIPANLTLMSLNNAIQRAFDFDNDHLHCFIYKDRFGRAVSVNHYYMDEPPYSDQTLIGETPLRPGETMKYVFDFGDNWQFDILLEAIDPPNPKVMEARIIESRGKAPKQYG
ncbi:MAG: plasmid pRiA4b ORF-3 family protein [Blastocatellia bacterium]